MLFVERSMVQFCQTVVLLIVLQPMGDVRPFATDMFRMLQLF